MATKTVNMLDEAATLIEDVDDGWEVNEYVRAIVELAAYAIGTHSDHRDAVETLLRLEPHERRSLLHLLHEAHN